MTRLDSPALVAPVARSFDFGHCIWSSVINGYRVAFRCATGISFDVVPPDVDMSAQTPRNMVCYLLGCTRAGRALCRNTHLRGRQQAEDERGPVQVRCFTGLTHVAAPVESHGRIVALLWSEEVFCRPPTRGNFASASAPIRHELDPAREREARCAYFALPIITAERQVLAMNLLGELARLLVEEDCRSIAISKSAEPAAVANAKRFIHANIGVPISPRDVVRHLVINQSYFCRLFKRTTRLKLSEYILRNRLEDVRKRLVHSSLLITEVAEMAGFNSIPHFNRVFKRNLGMSPTQYRRTRVF